MTYRGILMQLDRHGINRKNDCGIISKASFEEIMNIFVKAAVFGQSDNMKGVSANVLAGQVCKCGTNSFDLLLSMDDIISVNNKVTQSTSTIDIDMADLDNLDDVLIKEFKKNVIIKTNMFNFGLNMINHEQSKLNEFIILNIKINTIGNSNNYETTDESDNDSDTDLDDFAKNNSDSNIFGNNFEETDTESEELDESDTEDELNESDSDDELDENDTESKSENKESNKNEELDESDTEELDESDTEELDESDTEELDESDSDNE